MFSLIVVQFKRFVHEFRTMLLLRYNHTRNVYSVKQGRGVDMKYEGICTGK